MTTTTLQTLRVKPDGGVRIGGNTVAHVFREDDVWHPWRLALCGKEYLGETLTSQRADKCNLCVRCRRESERATT